MYVDTASDINTPTNITYTSYNSVREIAVLGMNTEKYYACKCQYNRQHYKEHRLCHSFQMFHSVSVPQHILLIYTLQYYTIMISISQEIVKNFCNFHNPFIIRKAQPFLREHPCSFQGQALCTCQEMQSPGLRFCPCNFRGRALPRFLPL